MFLVFNLSFRRSQAKKIIVGTHLDFQIQFKVTWRLNGLKMMLVKFADRIGLPPDKSPYILLFMAIIT
jgi:hypothetical protein